MINYVTRWLEITQYDDKRAISMVNLVETTWLTGYPRTTKIMYDQGSEFIGHAFSKSRIGEEYGIIDRPNTSENSMSNAKLVPGNLVRTYNIKVT